MKIKLRKSKQPFPYICSLCHEQQKTTVVIETKTEQFYPDPYLNMYTPQIQYDIKTTLICQSCAIKILNKFNKPQKKRKPTHDITRELDLK